MTALVDAELRRPPEDASHSAPQPEHSSQDDGEAEADEEAHAATRGAPVRHTVTERLTWQHLTLFLWLPETSRSHGGAGL